jgi:hypothetical protein
LSATFALYFVLIAPHCARRATAKQDFNEQILQSYGKLVRYHQYVPGSYVYATFLFGWHSFGLGRHDRCGLEHVSVGHNAARRPPIYTSKFRYVWPYIILRKVVKNW